VKKPAKPPLDSCISYGGTLEECVHPLIRMFPYPRHKRSIKVVMSVFYGCGTHFYTSVVEEDNPAWDGELWRYPWVDRYGKGLSFHEKFDTEDEAKAWVRAIVAEHFSLKTHKVVCNDNLDTDEPLQWFYREGD